MVKPNVNSLIRQRLDDLIEEGEAQWHDFTESETSTIGDPVRWTQWTTSCLNLLDKLSVSTNRFVNEFEQWVRTGRPQIGP